MKFIRYPQYRPLTKTSVITIGNFDGVHIGHQALIKRVTIYAEENGLQSIVVSMQPLASEYFAGKNNIALLTPFKCKYSLIRNLGIDVLCLLNFNYNLAQYQPNEFIQKILLDGLNAKHIIIGDDFRFGKNRAGDIKFMKNYCKPLGVSISHINSVIIDNERIASSKIRQHLQNNDFDTARSHLGRSFSIAGRVQKGRQIGREIGFPTININLSSRKIPIAGVFCVKVRFKQGQTYLGAASLGTRPTVNGKGNTLEVFILDFNKQIYGENVEVLFYHKLRNEVKFDSLDELKQNIQDDVVKTSQFFDMKKRKEASEH